MSKLISIQSKSAAGELNVADVKKVLLNFLTFNVPVFVLGTLTCYLQTNDLKISFITASVTFLTAFVDLVKKYQEDNTK